MPSLIPLAGTLPESLEIPQISGRTAPSDSVEPAGLFQLVLGQLTIEAPAVGPIVPETQPAFPVLSPETADQLLPPAGNVLPQLPGANIVEEVTTVSVQLTDKTAAATESQAGLIPVPALPQSAGSRPVSTPIVHTGSPATDPAPLPAGSMQLPVRSTQLNTQQAQPDVPLQTAAAPVPEALTLARPASTTVNATAADIATGLIRQTDNQHAVQAVAPEGLPALAGPSANNVQATTATTQQLHSYTISHPIADNRWSESLGQRVMWMTDNGIGRAEIRLNPPELGPLEIRVTVANDEAKVAFSVQHGTTREAVESAMPRLREMFAQQGIDLTDASVSQQSPDERPETDDNGSSTHNTNPADTKTTEFEEADAIAAGYTHSREGIIDTYV